MVSVQSIFKDVTPQESSKMIIENVDNSEFVLLDVRTPAEYQSGHLEGAINVDYQSDFKAEIEKMNKGKKYLLYCRTGIRSDNAMQIMRYSEFKEVYNMLGGISLWADEGFPIVK
jgi:rhodanese-related sulfurtransferase